MLEILQRCLCPVPHPVPWGVCLLDWPLGPALQPVSGLSSGPSLLHSTDRPSPASLGSCLYSGTVGLHPGQWRQHLRWVTLSSHLITPLGPALLFTTWQKERKKCASLWWVRKNPVKKIGNKVSVHAEKFLGFTEQHTSFLWKNDSSRKTLNKKIYKCK